MPNYFFSLLQDIPEEVKIPLVEGFEIKVAREVPESWSGVKKAVPAPSKWICRDQRGYIGEKGLVGRSTLGCVLFRIDEETQETCSIGFEIIRLRYHLL